MAKINQIVAIEKGVKSQAYSTISELNKVIQKSELFSGFTKNYRKINEEFEDLPSENKKVQRDVKSILDEVKTAKTDYWNINARREWSNCVAKADVKVHGATILLDVPVTYLLFLEKELVDLRTFISNLPVLDNNEDWQYDDTTGYQKTRPIETHRTKKIQKPIVLYDATPEHPAQTQIVTEDILAGYWSTTKFSGAVGEPLKKVLYNRVETLYRAVKEARELANSLEEDTTTPNVGDALFNYILSN